MLFKIIFFLLFLLGVSLFISTVATIILKKRARKKIHSKALRHAIREAEPRRDIAAEVAEKADEYQRTYLDRVSEVKRSFPQERVISKEKAAIQGEVVPSYKRKLDYGNIKWVFIVLVLVGVLFSGTMFWVKYYKVHSQIPKLYLCENVDFIKLKPKRSSDRFTRGNVTVFFKSKSPIKQKYLYLEIYKLGEAGFVPYAKKKINIKPEWTSFVATVLFDQIGNYIVEIKGPDNKLIVQKLVEIVPDSYAYKAKPRYVP